MDDKNRIALARRSRGLTQKQVADALVVSVQAVSQWETGKSFPRGSRLRQLSRILGVDAEWFSSEDPSVPLDSNHPRLDDNVKVPIFANDQDLMLHLVLLSSIKPNIKGYVFSNLVPIGELFALRVQIDDTPVVGFKSGDLLILDTGLSSVLGDVVYRVKVGNEANGTYGFEAQNGIKLGISAELAVSHALVDDYMAPGDAGSPNEFERYSYLVNVKAVMVERRTFRAISDEAIAAKEQADKRK